jgi:hypothetical protein
LPSISSIFCHSPAQNLRAPRAGGFFEISPLFAAYAKEEKIRTVFYKNVRARKKTYGKAPARLEKCRLQNLVALIHFIGNMLCLSSDNAP